MECYELSFDDDDENPYWELCINEEQLERANGDIWAYSRGERSPRTERVPCLIDHEGIEADCDIDALSGTPIVSQRLADLLSEIAPDDIQLIPVELDAPGTWAIVNVLPIVDAIDYDNSIISYHDTDNPTFAGKPRGIIRLIVKPALLGQHSIVRLKDWTVSIIVTEVLRERCRNTRMTNLKFIPATITNWNRYATNPKDDQWCFRPWR